MSDFAASSIFRFRGILGFVLYVLVLSEIVTYKAYRKDLICIENEKMKKPRKSHPNKIMNKERDFLGNANFQKS